MKKRFVILLVLITLSCSKNPETYIKHLQGYWEIDEVMLPDGTKRDYNYNETIDFLNITDSLTGFRKKLKPNFDGSYSTSDDVETIILKIENDSLNIYYKTPYSEWKETILEATATKLIIQNKENLRYIYKRYEPLDLN